MLRSRRRTLVITVSAGSVVVKAPLGFPDVRIREFVAQKADWIEKKLEQFSSDRFASVRAGKTILCDGAEYPLVYGASRCGEEGGVFYMKDGPSVRSYFLRTRGPGIERELGVLSARTGIHFSAVCLRDFKARWGSCDAEGKICLNWRLAMLPPRLRAYVLIHELCHRRHLDHSAAFWAEVSGFCPQYRALRKELKEYSFLTLLYRTPRPSK